MKALDYFATHPLFTHEEFVAFHRQQGGRSHHTSNNVLAHHLTTGRLLRIRKGLYATVPRGIEPRNANVDPYLLATKLTGDAVVAYHAALQYHGKAYSVWGRFHFNSRIRARGLFFRGLEFVPVRVSPTLRSLPDLGGEILEERHAGGLVRVTTLERTLVDMLSAQNRAGSWEETWRSLEMVEYFDLDRVIIYATRLASPLTAARLGFFLEQHQQALDVEGRHLEMLRGLAPAQPRYFDSLREPGVLIAHWNLIVPNRILDRTWMELG